MTSREQLSKLLQTEPCYSTVIESDGIYGMVLVNSIKYLGSSAFQVGQEQEAYEDAARLALNALYRHNLVGANMGMSGKKQPIQQQQEDFVSKLFHLCQMQKLTLNFTFTQKLNGFECVIDIQPIGTNFAGFGTSKKVSKQEAARLALESMN